MSDKLLADGCLESIVYPSPALGKLQSEGWVDTLPRPNENIPPPHDQSLYAIDPFQPTPA